MWNLKKGNFREEPTIVLTLKQIIEKLENYIGYLLKFKYFYLKKTGICCLCLTNVQYGKFYVHNNTFTLNFLKIRVNLLTKFKSKNIILGISEDFIDIYIF